MPRGRKQKVALRFRRREQLKTHVRTAIVRSVALALLVGFGAGLFAGNDPILYKFMQRHTPQVAIHLPQTLIGLPVLPHLPANHFWFWFPGSAISSEKRLTRKYTAVRAVRFERQYGSNRVDVYVEPRIPLVIWNGQGLDREGILFAVTPGAWKSVPQATFLPTASKSELGRWLARMAETSPLWTQLGSLKQDPYGIIEMTLKTGSVVIWGTPEPKPFVRKAQALVRVLDDAHNHLGGTARADLRFFDQGRIIVMPKSSR